MAKLYDFRFVIRQAEFYPGGAAVHYGGPATVFHESAEQLTFTDAQERMRQLSAGEARPHCVFISMKYRDDRKPAGFNDTKKTTLYGGGAQ